MTINTVIMCDNKIDITIVSKNEEEKQSSNTYYNASFHVYLDYKTDYDDDNNIKTNCMIDYNNKYSCFDNITKIQRVELRYANAIDIRFRNRYPTEDEMKEILSTYNCDGSSIYRTYCSHSGKNKGFIFMNYLCAMEGYEQYEINKFMKIAYEIARKTNLSVDGPHCSVNWY